MAASSQAKENIESFSGLQQIAGPSRAGALLNRAGLFKNIIEIHVLNWCFKSFIKWAQYHKKNNKSFYPYSTLQFMSTFRVLILILTPPVR